MSKINKEYNNLLNKIFREGYLYEDPNRKNVNRLEIPSYTFRHEFKDGFPAITTKKLAFKSVVTELIWFLRGDTNIKYLVDNGCNIWNKDGLNYHKKKYPADLNLPMNEFIEQVKEGVSGDLGPIYGTQWRGIYDKKADDISRYDQIKTLINTLKNNPLGTQHIVNSWNVLDLDDMALQPCHYEFQIVVRPITTYKSTILDLSKPYDKSKEKILGHEYGFELHWNQRSVDTFLGLPFNIASYATLALIIEKITGYKALAIQGYLKKVHLYDNSFDAVKEQLGRDVDKYDCGVFDFSVFDEYQWKTLDQLFNKIQPEDITLEGYESYPSIKIEMLERDE